MRGLERAGCGKTACPRGRREGNAAEQSGGSARVPRVLRSLRLGFQGTGETPFTGRRGSIGVRARGKKVTGDLAGRCAPGKKEERGKKGVDRWDRTARERKGEELARAGPRRERERRERRGAGENWAGARPTRKEEGRGRGRGRAGPRVAHAGERRGKGLEGGRGRGKGGGRAERGLGWFLSFFFTFFFSTLKPFKQPI
jgi:hypothetical protein